MEPKELDTKLDAVTKDLDDKIKALETKAKTIEDLQAKAIAGSGFTPAGNRAGSFEQKCLSSFGAKNVQELLTANTGSRKYRGVDPATKQAVRTLKENIDIARWVKQMYYGAPKDTDEHVAQIKDLFDTNFGREVEAQLKAFGTGADGAEWIPTAHAQNYIEEFELERRVPGLFREIPMPTNPFKLNVQSNTTTAQIVPEDTAQTAVSFGTDNITFDATKIGQFYRMPEELNEDSIVDMLAVGRDQVVQAVFRALETMAINGDSDGTHQDSDTQAGSANLAEKAVDGLRKLALANSANGATYDFANAAVDATGLDTMIQRSGKYSVNVRDLVFLFSPGSYHQASQLPEVTSVEKFGPMATILEGALRAYRGIPLVISEYLRQDMNATGVYDGVTTDRGAVLLCNKTRFMWGRRRPIRMRMMQDLADQDRWLIASYARYDFQGHTQDADEVSDVYGYNVAL